MKTFGEYIRCLRESRDMPQRKVAQALDIDVSVLSRIESGNRFPRRNLHQLISRLAALFNKEERELWDNYMSDEIAFKLLGVDNIDEIIGAAKRKINYLRNKQMTQSTINFDKNEGY